MKIKIAILILDSANAYHDFDITTIDQFPEHFTVPYKTVMAIDPGSNSMGITFGSMTEKKPIIAMQFKRNKNLPDESSTDMYIFKTMNLILKIAKQFNVEDTIIEDQYMDPRYVESYRVLTSLKDSIRSVLQVNGFKVPYMVKPASWKSIFLAEAKRLKNINLNESNKKYVIEESKKRHFNMFFFTDSDPHDALGILYYYYNNFFSSGDSILKAVKDMKRDKTHKLVCVIGKSKSFEDTFKKADNFRKSRRREDLKLFKLDESMTIDENVRGFTTNSNDVFISFFKPFLVGMPELFRCRSILGEIKEDTMLYVLGMRENMK